jgi:hypothetical protein
MIESDEIVNDGIHEWPSRFARHEIVADAYGLRDWEHGWSVQEERVYGCPTPNVQIKIDAAIMMQHKVADHVCSLDIVSVAIESGEELDRKDIFSWFPKQR